MANQMLLDRLQEIKQLSRVYTQKYYRGISIIIPTYKGEQYIHQCLLSLFNQTLDQKLFEVIFIINGEKDSTESMIQNFISENGMNNIFIYYSEEAGASAARNVGIEKASRQYAMFLDDDDYLSNNYLEELYKNASQDNIVVSQIVNVNSSGHIEVKNPINKQIVQVDEGQIEPSFRSLSMVATISACKLVPTETLKKVRFDTELKSGEDIVFFMELYIKSNMNFKVIPANHQVVYYRLLRDDSVSRQKLSFDFNVIQRLEVIKRLDSMLNTTDDEVKQQFIKQKVNAQFGFLNRYLKEHVGERDKVFAKIKEYNLSYIPYAAINRDLASKLVISYCFPPFVDTSGNVMAKRIRTMNETVDVIYNKMDKVRTSDNRLNALSEDLIDKRIEVASSTSFSNWKAMEQFVDLGVSKIDLTKYTELYSRAMWPGSHFLAYKLKTMNPNLKWTAEFSDPLLMDIHGKRRQAKIDNEEFLNEVKINAEELGYPPLDDDNLFLYCEYLPYVFADELIFTNKNQLDYMVNYFPIQEMKAMIRSKAIISPQPTLPNEFYSAVKSNYVIDSTKVNFAYFGSFYDTRKLDDLFTGLERVRRDLRKNIRLHIFTSDPSSLDTMLESSTIRENVIVQPYVHYLEFLNLTTKFDCLIVNDAKTLHNKKVNPYLPSKLSDYAGSGAKIWGVYEETSILSTCKLDFKSLLGNIKAATKVYEKMANNKKKRMQR